jgi:Cu/Ag efflux protein CusF
MSDLQKTLPLFLVTFVGLVPVACGQHEYASQPPVVHTYDVRGVVRQLPRPAAPQPEIWIRHESISGFVDISGEVKGMDAMTMPFFPAQELSLDGIAVGDKITFKLEVDWQATPPAQLTAIEKLAAETVLEWEAAEKRD